MTLWHASGWTGSTGRVIQWSACLPAGAGATVWANGRNWRWKLNDRMDDEIALHKPYRSAAAAKRACTRALRFQLRRALKMVNGGSS